ncbi:MAG: arsenate-mycothiol transferase ArsC [Thermodesulfobacteriota bacterium]
MKNDNRQKMNILFVCSGNTCRSPMAKALAEELLGDSAHVESAGIDTSGGEGASQETIGVLRERGINLQAHRSRNIKKLGKRHWQVVIAMTPNIKKRLLESKSILTDSLVAWEIPDPINQGDEAYKECAQSIEARLQELISTMGGKGVSKS